jgi:replicative DNA helicase
VNTLAPPHCDEIEASFLGLVITCGDHASVARAADTVKPEHFYSTNHQKVYAEAMAILRSHGKPDPVQLVDRLGKSFEGLVLSLADARGHAHDAPQFAREIRGTAQCRTVMFACQEAAANLSSDRHDLEAITALRHKIDDCIAACACERTADEVYEEILNQHYDQVSGKGKSRPIPSGFRTLDKHLPARGWTRGLHIIGGWSSMGKSAVLVSCIASAIREGFKVRVISLDMGVLSYVRRLAAVTCGVPLEEVYQAKSDHVSKCVGRLMAAGVTWDTHSVRIEDIVCSALSKVDQWDLLAIDYVQNITVQGARGIYERTTEATRQLKAIVTETDKPVLVLSQLNEQPTRKDFSDDDSVCPVPTMNQLRGSGDITCMATTITMPWRPSGGKYGGGGDEDGFLILAKNQDGQTCQVPVRWHSRQAVYREPDVQKGVFDGE